MRSALIFIFLYSPMAWTNGLCLQNIEIFFKSQEDAIKNIPSLPFKTLGIEFEGLMPPTATFRDMAEELRVFVEQKFHYETTVRQFLPNLIAKGYTVAYAKNKLSYNFEVKFDASIHENFTHSSEEGIPDIEYLGRKYAGVEISSPIIRSHEDLKEYLYVLNAFKQWGIRPFPKKAGVHLHFGIDDYPGTINQKFRNLKIAYGLLVNQINQFFLPVESRSILSDVRPDFNKVDQIHIHQASFFTKIKTTKTGNTFEVKIFNSEDDIELIVAYIEFVTKFNTAILENSQSLNALLERSRSGQGVSIDEVLDVIDAHFLKRPDIVGKIQNRNAEGLGKALSPFPQERFVLDLFALSPDELFQLDLKALLSNIHLSDIPDVMIHFSQYNLVKGKNLWEYFLKTDPETYKVASVLQGLRQFEFTKNLRWIFDFKSRDLSIQKELFFLGIHFEEKNLVARNYRYVAESNIPLLKEEIELLARKADYCKSLFPSFSKYFVRKIMSFEMTDEMVFLIQDLITREIFGQFEKKLLLKHYRKFLDNEYLDEPDQVALKNLMKILS